MPCLCLQGVASQIESLRAGVDSSLGGALSGASSTVQSSLDSLPPEVRDVLVAVPSTLSAAAAAAAHNPTVAAAGTGFAVGLPAIAFWKAKFGGYAGTLDPTKAYDMLQVRAKLWLAWTCTSMFMHVCMVMDLLERRSENAACDATNYPVIIELKK